MTTQPLDPVFAKQPSAWSAAALVFAVALVCYFPYPLYTPLAATEGHRAMTAHQMVESGQWLVPRLYGRVYGAKPPLHYWLLAASETLFRTTSPWVWRLPAAIEGALLATILCLFANRWFGRTAAWIAGFSYVALFTLWGENRGADIDVTNTFTATLACLCLLEIHLAHTAKTRRLVWLLAAGLFIAASLMVKGPASLTIILGTYLAIAITRRRTTGWRWLIRFSTWLPLLIGIAIFVFYVAIAFRYCKIHHLPPDLTGVQEGTQDLHPHGIDFKKMREWLLLPLTMFLYATPVSLALFFAFRRDARSTETGNAQLLSGLAFSVLVAWGICFISGMHLPRYAFVTLPLLCPLAGAVAARLEALATATTANPYVASPVSVDATANPAVLSYRSKKPVAQNPARWIHIILIVTAILFGVTAIVLTQLTFKTADVASRIVLLIASIGGSILAVIVTVRLSGSARTRAAGLIPVIIVLTSVTFALRQQYDRLRRNSIPQAQLIRSIVGDNAYLITCAMVLDQPDLFYYSGVPTTALDGDMLDWRRVPTDSWVVLEPQELAIWQSEVPRMIWNQTPFVANRNKGILLWYGSAPKSR